MWEPPNKEELILDHVNRVPLKSLSVKYNTSIDKIRNCLKRTDNWQPYKVSNNDLPIGDIINLYKSDVSKEDIATTYNVSVSPIVKILNDYKVRKPKWLKHLPYTKISQLLDKEYFTAIVNVHVGLHHIMTALDVGEALVKQLCKYHHIVLLNNSGLVRSIKNRQHRNSIPLTLEVFNEQHFKNNHSIADISKMMGISTDYLRKHIRQWNIITRDTRISLKFRKFCKLSNVEIQQIVNETAITKLYKNYEVSLDVFRQKLKEKSINIPIRFMSSNEKNIGDYIETLGVTVERNNRKLIYPYELDIYIPSKNVAIEYCGLYWHSELNNRGRNYHLNKLQRCNDKGIRLITIFDDEYIGNEQLINAKIRNILQIQSSRIKVNARSCVVNEISAKEKKEFMDIHHIQGNDISNIKLGLYYNKELVSVMTFAKPSTVRYRTKTCIDGVWELNRFATSGQYNVRGAAGKLLSYFKNNYNWNMVYSYADKRWSDGGLYNTLHFTKVTDSAPNYWYVPKGYYKREYRYKYAKYKLVEQGFDSNKSEKQIMEDRGFTRVWDCGHHKFEMYKKGP